MTNSGARVNGTLNKALFGTSWKRICASNSSIRLMDIDSGSIGVSPSSPASSLSVMFVANSTDWFLSVNITKEGQPDETHGIEHRRVKGFLVGANKERLYGHTRLGQILQHSRRSEHKSRLLVELTTSVVRAEVISRLLAAPGCGLSSSVIKKTRLVAVFGMLSQNKLSWHCENFGGQRYPSRMTQLQLVKTSPTATRLSFMGGNFSLRLSGFSLASISMRVSVRIRANNPER